MSSVLKNLAGDEGGIWLVRSEAVAFIFDLDQMLVRRFRGGDPDEQIIDGWDNLLAITRCEIGRAGEWVTDRDVFGSDTAPQRRDTTQVVVVHIERAVRDGSGALCATRLDEEPDTTPGDAETDPMKVDELLGGETGAWIVHTRDSHYEMRLDEGTVQRFAGPTSNPSPNDGRRRLRDISACKVGARGRWTMWPVDGDPDVNYMWQDTSVVRSIEREVDDGNR